MQLEKTRKLRLEIRGSHRTRSTRGTARGRLRAYWLVTTFPDATNYCSNATSNIDVKPDNVLINYGKDSSRFSRVALGDEAAG